ncbi:MAG TPA: GNAT family N-acetyltransferase [Gemmatimonadales bacterium]|nr:GNAT family N-acetyltransferase [Gemmatimonadales bacterium]
MRHVVPLETARLRLVPLTPEAIDALLAGDGARLGALTGGAFPVPPGPPPLMEALLPQVRRRLLAEPDTLGWWTWLALDRATRRATGASGFGGPPDADGAVMIGYATYPGAEGRGYATEAAGALIRWALAQPGVTRVCASIPPDNTAARRVAEKLGMAVVGTLWEEEIDEVLLYAIAR